MQLIFLDDQQRSTVGITWFTLKRQRNLELEHTKLYD